MFGGLWRHPSFLKLWAGQTVSLFGSRITSIALPLAAWTILGAGPVEVGILGASNSAAFLLVGLFAGVWADRLRRRPILLAADIGRALLLLVIPAAAVTGLLRIELLYVVAAVVGVLTVFFEVAYQPFLTTLVGGDHLVEGNSKLEVSRSAADVLGTGIAGVLVHLLTAPIAIFVDAMSFLVSAAFLGIIGEREVLPERIDRRSIWSEIGEGLSAVVRSPILRPLAFGTAVASLFYSAVSALYVLYLTRDLRMEAAILGLVFGLGSLGDLFGAIWAERLAVRVGLGPTIIAGILTLGLGVLLLPIAVGPAALVVATQIAAWLLIGFGAMIYNVNAVSLRIGITPPRLQGRVNASVRFMIWGSMPLGAILGGLIGERIGLQAMLLLAGAGLLGSAGLLMASPLHRLRVAPTPSDDTPGLEGRGRESTATATLP